MATVETMDRLPSEDATRLDSKEIHSFEISTLSLYSYQKINALHSILRFFKLLILKFVTRKEKKNICNALSLSPH